MALAGLISKKAALHVQHTLFVHCSAVVLHDYNVKLPGTSLGLFTWSWGTPDKRGNMWRVTPPII